MPVEAIRLQNFMAFEDTGWVELRPITLLFGRNSSGKSALIRGLRLLKQSRTTPREAGPLAFTARWGLDQGSFIATVHGHRSDDPIVFGFRCSVEDDRIADDLAQRIGMARGWEPNLAVPSHPEIEVSIGFSLDHPAPLREVIRPTYLRIEVPTPGNADPRRPILFALERLDHDVARDLGEGWRFWSDILVPARRREWPDLSLDAREQGFWPQIATAQPQDGRSPPEEIAFLRRLLTHLQEDVNGFLERIQHVGPQRPEPERFYALNEWQCAEWEERGWGAFLDFLRGNALDEPELRRLDRWLHHLELGDEVEVRSLAREQVTEVLSRVALLEAPGGLWLNLKDVGFGAAQVLPVLVAALLAERGSMVIIEQPELHLHPRAQARLADLFVEMARNEVRFLIETHSEHLLIRLRRWTTEHEVGRKVLSTPGTFLALGELSVSFVHRNAPVSTVAGVEIGEYGELIRPPEEFDEIFSSDIVESLDLAKLRFGIEDDQLTADHEEPTR